MSAILRASRDFWRALLRDANTMDAKTPIIAMTTRSSMSVKPPEVLLFGEEKNRMEFDEALNG
jgi:hypothetical protein